MTLLQYVMNGLSSDLGIAVRENRGLAYFVGAYQQIGLEPGAFVVYAGTHEKPFPSGETIQHRDQPDRDTGIARRNSSGPGTRSSPTTR